MQPYVVTDQSNKSGEAVVAWVLTVITCGYFLPWAVAATRGKSNSGAVGLITLLAGWTFVGWIVALVMACGPHQLIGGYAPAPYVPNPYGPPTGAPQALPPAAPTAGSSYPPPPADVQPWEPPPATAPDAGPGSETMPVSLDKDRDRP